MLDKKNNSSVTARHQRNEVLDFVKGLLIYSMVIYHVSYNFSEHYQLALFVTKYVSGAFIYITGFLIGHYYFERHGHNISHIRSRLFIRGSKIFLLFLALNMTLFMAASRQGQGGALQSAIMKYIVLGTGEAHFEILLPISYILLFSSLTISFFQSFQTEDNKALILNICLFVILLFLSFVSLSTNFHFFVIGLFGLTNSLIVNKIKNTDAMQLFTIFLVIAIAFLRFSFAVGATLFIYILYIIVVLATFYNIGQRINLSHFLAQWTVGIGRHTLFAYLYHIFLIGILSRIYPLKTTLFGNVLIVFMISGIVIFSITALDRLRRANNFVDRTYAFIFR